MRLALAFLIVCMAGTAQAATTLNPSDKSTNATLSNGNLTVTTTPSAYSGVRSTTSKSSGKWYFEVTINAVGGSTAYSIGLGNTSATLASIVGIDANGTGYTRFQDSMSFNSGQESLGSLGSISVGSVYAVAIDFGSKNIWIRGPGSNWNGRIGDDPATNVGGLLPNHNGNGACFGGTCATVLSNWNTLFGTSLYAMVTVFQNSQVTANFGATATTYTIPSGFTMWDGTPATNGARHPIRID